MRFKKTHLFSVLTVSLAVLACATAHAMARRPPQQWAFFHFDGSTFAAGRPSTGPAVALMDGFQPVVVAPAGVPQGAKFPAGKGGVAGICYLQRSGGKLSGTASFQPAAGLQVHIVAGDRTVSSVTTDANGYFVAVLPAGRYRITAGAAIEVTVEAGSTTLIPLRVGKRMVD